MNAGIHLGVPLWRLGNAIQCVELRKDYGERSTLAQHFEEDFRPRCGERSFSFLPDAFRNERARFTRIHHALHQLAGLIRDAKTEVGEPRSKPRNTEDAHWIFHESVRHMAEQS